MLPFSTWSPLVGGALIGLSASLFLLAHGRVAGISGLFGSLLCRTSSAPLVRMTFIAGLVVGGIALGLLLPQVFATSWSPSLPHALVAGLLVGVGTQLSSGCTSGHGICGITRGSLRSFVATGTFMLTGFVTVFLVRHALGGAP
ncbi:MAG TPA: YeeE/YedE thiosulfate transporter family protein [Polyangiaceae bacterium]|nr:YeeE/YedE thiosulfate transporter family protein [Polyangiaceae bacterium]